MSIDTILYILVVLSGLYMAWSMGANDVANAMGTSVGSGALRLKQAVMMAAVLEFAGAFFFGTYVSETIQNGIVNAEIFAGNPMTYVYGMLAALLASAVWLHIASYYGWPVSTTHSIVGALVGFGAYVGGVQAVYWGNVAYIVTSWVLSPLIGGVISYFLFSFLRNRIFYHTDPIARAKKITPFLVFIVCTMMALILLYKGLKNIEIHLTFMQSALWSAGIGLLGSLISMLLLRRIGGRKGLAKDSFKTSPEVMTEISKAFKHLKRIQNATEGEANYQVSQVITELENISDSLKNEPQVGHSDFTIVEKIFGYLQIMSACLMAFAHGANDVANAIGPMSAVIGVLSTHKVGVFEVPAWALAVGGLGIVVGVTTWGWRVIETIGKKLTELTPTRGFAAEFGAAATILIASRLGLPVSTTHTLVGSVVGVGLARGIEALNLSMTRDIIVSWLVTVPAGAVVAIIFFNAIFYFFG